MGPKSPTVLSCKVLNEKKKKKKKKKKKELWLPPLTNVLFSIPKICAQR